MLPGASGLRWMPRKMAGIAMITIEASIVAIVMLRVVLDSATHLYRPFLSAAAQLAVPGRARVIRPGATGPGVTRLACTSLLFAACRRMPLLSRFPHVPQA